MKGRKAAAAPAAASKRNLAIKMHFKRGEVDVRLRLSTAKFLIFWICGCVWLAHAVQPSLDFAHAQLAWWLPQI